MNESQSSSLNRSNKTQEITLNTRIKNKIASTSSRALVIYLFFFDILPWRQRSKPGFVFLGTFCPFFSTCLWIRRHDENVKN